MIVIYSTKGDASVTLAEHNMGVVKIIESPLEISGLGFLPYRTALEGLYGDDWRVNWVVRDLVIQGEIFARMLFSKENLYDERLTWLRDLTRKIIASKNSIHEYKLVNETFPDGPGLYGRISLDQLTDIGETKF